MNMSGNNINKESVVSKQESNEDDSSSRPTSPSQSKICAQPYTDYSDTEEIPIGAKEEALLDQYNENLLKGPFPFKLHIVLKVLDQEGSHDIMSWNSHGRSFIIKNQQKFEAEVMPRFFKTNQLPSFRRQLNLYEFVRVNEGPESGSYYHELFLRTKPLLSLKLERINRKSPDRLKQTCPKFETMKMLPALTHTVPLSLSKAPAKMATMDMLLQGSGINTYGQNNLYGSGSRSAFGMNVDGMGLGFNRVNPSATGSFGPSEMTIEQQVMKLAQQQMVQQQIAQQQTSLQSMQLKNSILGGNNLNNTSNMGISLNDARGGFPGWNNVRIGDDMNRMNSILGNVNNSRNQEMMNMRNIGQSMNVGPGGMNNMVANLGDGGLNNMMTNMGDGAISSIMANLGGGRIQNMMGNIGGGAAINMGGRMNSTVTSNMAGGSSNNMGSAINDIIASRLNNIGATSMNSFTHNNIDQIGGSDISKKMFATSNQQQMQHQQMQHQQIQQQIIQQQQQQQQQQIQQQQQQMQQQIIQQQQIQQQGRWMRNSELNSASLTLSERQQLMMLQQLENSRQNISSGGNDNSAYNYLYPQQMDKQSDSDDRNMVDKKRKSDDNGDEVISDGLGSYLRRRGRGNRSSSQSTGDNNYEEASFTSSKNRLEHETASSRKSSKNGSGMHDLTVAALKMANISFPSDIGSSQWTLDVRSDDLNMAKTYMSTQSERGSETGFGSLFQRRPPTLNSNFDSQKETANKISRHSEMHHDVHYKNQNFSEER